MADVRRKLWPKQKEFDRRRRGRYGRTRSEQLRLSESPVALPGYCPGIGHGCQNHLEQYQWVVRGSIPVAPTIPYKKICRLLCPAGNPDQNAKSTAPSNQDSQIAGAKNRPNGSRDVALTGRLPNSCQAP